MNEKVRLQDESFSKGLETVTSLTRCADFTVELGQQIRQPGGAERAVRAMLREFFPESNIGPSQGGHPYIGGSSAPQVEWIGEVSVNYGIRPTFKQLNGEWFDWANERYGDTAPVLRSEREGTPTSGIETRRYGYLHLNRNATDEQALEEIKRARVLPATDLETMYFGNTFREEQRKFPIVGLGSFFRIGGLRNSSVLRGHGSERSLGLDWSSVDGPWNGSFRVLVRE